MGPSDTKRLVDWDKKEKIEKYQENVFEEAIYLGERLLSGSLSFYASLTIGQVSKTIRKQRMYI